MAKLKLPNVPMHKADRQLQALQRRLDKLKQTERHLCHDIVSPLLSLCFERQVVERQLTTAENRLRKLDLKINDELNKLSRKVGFNEG